MDCMGPEGPLFAVCTLAVAPQALQFTTMASATCIALQSACDSGVVSEQRLADLAAAAELRVRKVASMLPDLMVVKAGSTLAFVLWQGGSAGGTADGSDSSDRLARLASAFKLVYVLVPHAMLDSPAVLDAVSRLAALAAKRRASTPVCPCHRRFSEQQCLLCTAHQPTLRACLAYLSGFAVTSR